MTSRAPRWVWTCALALLVVLGLYMAREVLAPFVVAGALAYIFSVVVDRIQERLRWPRVVVVALLYLLALGTLALGLYFGAETLYRETQQLMTRGPDIVEQGVRQVMGDARYDFGGQVIDARFVAAQISQTAGALLRGENNVRWAEEAVRLLWEALLVLVVSFYLLLDGKKLGPYLLRFVPAGSPASLGYLSGRIHVVLGAYLRGQLLLVALISTQSFLVLQLVFHVPHALLLSILTGFLEVLPLVGPVLATAIAAAVALSAHGPGAAIGVIVGYLVLRQLEDQIIGPLVLGHAVNLHPVATMFAVLAGGAIAGVLGMALAIPTAAAIKTVLDFLYPANLDGTLARSRPGQHAAIPEAEAESAPEWIFPPREQVGVGSASHSGRVAPTRHNEAVRV